MKNRKNLRKQLGQGMTEYIIIVALIAVSSIGVYAFFGKTVRRTQTAGLAEEMSGKSAQANISAAQQEAGNATSDAAKKKGLGSYSNESVEGK